MNFVLFTNCNSLTYKEVACDDYCIKVIDDENHKIENNNTWGSLLIFLILRLLILNGYTKLGIDYFQVCAPLSRIDIVCMISKISQRNWKGSCLEPS